MSVWLVAVARRALRTHSCHQRSSFLEALLCSTRQDLTLSVDTFVVCAWAYFGELPHLACSGRVCRQTESKKRAEVPPTQTL